MEVCGFSIIGFPLLAQAAQAIDPSTSTPPQAAAAGGNMLQVIGLCIVSATVLAYVARITRQPLLLAYVAAGIVIGPIGLQWVGEGDRQVIQSLADLGLTFLLFIVGLEIDISKLMSAGLKAITITTFQVIGCTLLGAGVATLLGYGGMPAAYIGVAVALSSTMIVVKLLSDAGEIDTLAGRMSLAVTLLQDVFAIIALAIQPTLGKGGFPVGEMILAAIKGVGLLVVVLLLSRYVLPRLFRFVAMSPETVLLSAVSWCFLVCYAAIRLELSSAMGALLAGVGIASFPYSLDVVSKIRSLRDFFVTLFFVALGMLMTLPTPALLGAAAVLSLVTIASRLLTVWPIMRLVGYDHRAGVLSSIHTLPVSEFALVLVLIGMSIKPEPHVTGDIASLIVMMLVITATSATYLMRGSHQIAGWIANRMPEPHHSSNFSPNQANPDHSHDGPADDAPAVPPLMLVGLFRTGSALTQQLAAGGHKFGVIDFNPHLKEPLAKLGVPWVYGDISNPDTLEEAGVSHARILVCPISDDFLRGTNNRNVLESLRQLNPQATILVTAESPAKALELYDRGADYVLVPRLIAADQLLLAIEMAQSGDLSKLRQQHLARLKAANELVP